MRAATTASRSCPRGNNNATRQANIGLLVSRPAQSNIELLPLLFPTSLLGLRPFFERVAFVFDGRCPPVVLPFGFFDSSLRLGNCLLAALPLLLPDGLFLPTLVFAPSLRALECHGGLAS